MRKYLKIGAVVLAVGLSPIVAYYVAPLIMFWPYVALSIACSIDPHPQGQCP